MERPTKEDKCCRLPSKYENVDVRKLKIKGDQ